MNQLTRINYYDSQHYCGIMGTSRVADYRTIVNIL